MERSEHFSISFWDQLYRSGGTSGTGSAGRLASYKAEVVNGIIAKYGVRSAVELGCGDGSQLARIGYPQYIGLDTSGAVIKQCIRRFAHDSTKQFFEYKPFSTEQRLPSGDLAVSLDVIYHLLEDEVYERYMSDLFALGRRFVLVYSSNGDTPSRWDEVRHRRFTDWVDCRQPNWMLIAHFPQRFPYVEGNTETSWSDFFLYKRLFPGPRLDLERRLRTLCESIRGRLKQPKASRETGFGSP